MGKWIKRAGIAAFVLVVLGGFYLALREKPVSVDVVTVAEGPMQVTVRDEGITRVRDVYAIVAPIAGYLARTTLEEGDRVEAGRTPIATIRPMTPGLLDTRTEAELRAARDAAAAVVMIAESDLARAETVLALAESNRERALRLYGPGVVSQSLLQKVTNEAELQRAQVATARATVGLRKAELDMAKARLARPDGTDGSSQGCCIDVYAPADVVVLAMLARSEQPVAAGAKIAEIGDPDRLEVADDLLSSDAIRVRPGSQASLGDWGGERHASTRRGRRVASCLASRGGTIPMRVPRT